MEFNIFDDDDKKKIKIGIVLILLTQFFFVGRLIVGKKEVLKDPKVVTNNLISKYYEEQLYPQISKPKSYFEFFDNGVNVMLEDIFEEYGITSDEFYEDIATCNIKDTSVNIKGVEPFGKEDYIIEDYDLKCGANYE